MTGGLMQLVAYGAQDIYLTGNPMITFFKVVYRRHTNFAMESIEQTFNGVADFGKRVTATISRNGDLINGVYLQCDLPNLTNDRDTAWRWVDSLGHVLIQIVEVEIGGQLIDRHYGDWYEIWSQLTVPAGQVKGYKQMIGQDPLDCLERPSGLQELTPCNLPNPGPQYPSQLTGDMNTATSFNTPRTLYIPLQFWFCRNVGLSLPLIALQYHEVKINLTINNISSLILGFTAIPENMKCPTDPKASIGDAAKGPKVGSNIIATPPPSNNFPSKSASGSLQNCSLWVDYIYLDTDERRRFAQVSHEYLIEQLQFTGTETLTGSTTNVKLNYNHPVKELVWVLQPWGGMYNQWNNYTDTPAIQLQTNVNTLTGANLENLITNSSQTFSNPWESRNPFEYVKLQLNGHDRFYQRYGTYFNQVQTRDHHTNIPDSPGICVYSFALKPEDHQPSGTCNFSRIDNATLNVTLTANMLAYTKKTSATTPVATPALKVFATNYNVLRIMSGMGGLAYSN